MSSNSNWISSNVSSSSSVSFDSFHSEDLVSIRDLIDEQEKMKKVSVEVNGANASEHEAKKSELSKEKIVFDSSAMYRTGDLETKSASRRDSLQDKNVLYNYLNSTVGRKSGNIFPISPRTTDALLVSGSPRSEAKGDLSELEVRFQNMNIDINPEKTTKEIQTLPSQQTNKGTKVKRDQTDKDVEPSQKNPHNDAGKAVEEVTGDEGAKHESTIESSHTMEDDESLKGDLLIELDKLRNLVISANESLNLLTDIYQQRSQESLKNGEPVSFEVLKKEYAG